MITPEEYDLVQLILGRDGKPRKTKRAFAFTGAIRCQECGCLYTAEIKKKIIKGTGNKRVHILSLHPQDNKGKMHAEKSDKKRRLGITN